METKSHRQTIEATRQEPYPQAEDRIKAPEVEDDTPGRINPDSRGDSALAIPRQEGNPKPPYPEVARRRGYEGTVRLKVEVLASGEVGRIWVMESSSYEVLDRSALKTVKDWSFIPARFGGIPVKSTVIVPVTFQLKE
jgi:protein TonB